MGLAHMFLFLYKHNPMCSIYTRDLPYFFFPLILLFLFLSLKDICVVGQVIRNDPSYYMQLFMESCQIRKHVQGSLLGTVRHE